MFCKGKSQGRYKIWYGFVLCVGLSLLCFLINFISLSFPDNELQGFVGGQWQLVERRSNPYYWGRLESVDPSPRCCWAEECRKLDQGRYAIITMIRTQKYIPLVEELHCSLQRTNPSLKLIVIALQDEINPESLDRIRSLNNTELRFVQPIEFKSSFRDGRFAKNWVKLRAWEFDEFDAVLILDADMTVMGDLATVFNLPTDFAIVLDMDKYEFSYHSIGKAQGGTIFVRPCPPVAKHMIDLIDDNVVLQFQRDHAEQDFLDWYYKYSRWSLPVEYNYIAHMLDGGYMLGGGLPKILHFTRQKPFDYDPKAPGHQYLCIKPDHKSL